MTWRGHELLVGDEVYARIVHHRWCIVAEIGEESEEFDTPEVAMRWCEDRLREDAR